MKSRYIIQLKRRYYWEDVICYWDKRQCFIAFEKLLKEGRTVRIVEQVVANLSC